MLFRRRNTDVKSVDALVRGELHLQEAKASAVEVSEAANKLRKIREKNHFAEQLHLIMGGPVHGTKHGGA